MRSKRGFTLTELIAVIAIMAILAVGAISGYTTMTKNSKKKTYETKVQEIENAAIKYAKENNLSTSATISVNKLVVEGYIQPDEAAANGLSAINNPINNDNMICNLVTISLLDDIYVAEYKEDKKDCEIAEQEVVDANIVIKEYELDDNTISKAKDLLAGRSIGDWTKKDIVLETSSTSYADYVSISYDFDGQTITKAKDSTIVISNTTYNDSDYTRIAIRDVLVMFNSEVTITYNMADGSIHSRSVTVRIDRELPTARPVISNDVTVGSTKKVNLYLDDANGSGLAGFYVSKTAHSFSASSYIDQAHPKNGVGAGAGKLDGYKSYFYGEKGDYYIKVVDKAGNEYETEAISISNFEPDSKSCTLTIKKTDGTTIADNDWYNIPVIVTGETNNAVGSMGIKYRIKYFDSFPIEKDLTDFFDPNGNSGLLAASVSQNVEIPKKDFYLAMKGLEKDEDISYCKKTFGVDWTKPTVSFACASGDCNTYKKTHKIEITLLDDNSGFYDSARSIKIGWSTNRTTPPTEWETISGGTKSNYKNASNVTIEDGKIVINTEANSYAGGTALTGTYYMWVQGTSFADKAQNNADNAVSNFSIKYDNTPPSCTSRGGGNTWKNVNISIYGTCSDSHSGCATHANSGKYTYDASGNVTRLYDYDIESTTESPGEVYDAAGNHSTCPADRIVKRDTVKPNAPSLTITHSYNSSAADGSKATVYTNNTWINKDVYMTDARYSPFRGPSATDGGNASAIKSGIAKYQISTNNSTWVDYSYDYTKELYKLTTDGTHKRYIRAVDNAGNISNVTTFTIKIDKTAPTAPSLTMTHSYDRNAADGHKATVYTNNTWISKNVYMTDARYSPFRGPSASDSGSGVARYEISDNNSTWTTYSYNADDVLYRMISDGTYSRYLRAIDNAGNISEVRTLTIKIDKTAPTTPSLTMTHSYNSSAADGSKATVYTNNTWINKNVYMTDARYYPYRGPSASDSGSGIARYEISSNNSTWTTYSYNGTKSLYLISAEGTNNRYIRAVDNVGNISEVRTLTIKIDKTAPTAPSLTMTHSYNSSAAQGSKATVYTNNTWINKNVYMTDARYSPYRGPSASDSGSGIARYEISSNNSTWTTYSYNGTDSLYLLSAEGTNNRYIRAVDNAGNASSSTTLTIKIDKTPPTITMATYQYRSSIFKSPHDNTSCQIFPNDNCDFTLNTGQKVYQLTSASKSACINSIRAQIQWGCGPANYTDGSINNSNTSINNTNYIFDLVSVNNGPSEIALKSVTVTDNRDSSPTTTIKKGGFNPDASSQTANTSYTLNSISTVDASNHGVVYRIRAADDAGNVRTWDIIATHVGSNDVKANDFGETDDLMYFNKFIRVGETQFHKGWQQRYYIRTFYTGSGTNIEDITYLTFKSYYSDSTYKLIYNGKDYCPSQGCQIKGFKKIGNNWYYFNTNEVDNNKIPNGGMVVRGHGQNGKEVCKYSYDFLLNHVNNNGWHCDDHNKPHTDLEVDENGVCASGHHP